MALSLPLLHVGSQPYHWHWELHPDVIFVCALMLGAYAYAVTSLRAELSDAGRVKRSQFAMFTLGVLSIYMASSSPVHELAEGYLASVHMFQHLIYTMVAPPLLILGTPAWLFRAPLRNRTVLRVARVIALPLVCFALFNAVQVLTHMPSAVDLSLRVHSFHFLVHVVLVASAVLMWWPVLSPIEELPALSYPLQMAYLFVQSLVPSVIAAFLTFSDGALYDFYAAAPRTWGLTAVEDQQFAAAVMKILGSLVLWGFIAFAFFRWYEKENSESREPRWDEVADELQRMGLPLDQKRR
jgi:putative membrane protein